MDCKDVIYECNVRAEKYKEQGDIERLKHEQECERDIAELIFRAEKADKELYEAIKKLRDFDCETCTNSHCFVRNGTGSCNWEWNGHKAE